MGKPDGIPSGFVELNPEEVLKAVEGFEDELTPENNKLEAFYRQHRNCPRGCGPTMIKELDIHFAFADSDYSIPRFLMKCSHCNCIMNPFDGMVVNLGDPDTANAGGHVIKIDD